MNMLRITQAASVATMITAILLLAGCALPSADPRSEFSITQDEKHKADFTVSGDNGGLVGEPFCNTGLLEFGYKGVAYYDKDGKKLCDPNTQAYKDAKAENDANAVASNVHHFSSLDKMSTKDLLKK